MDAGNDEWFPITELTHRIGALIWVEEQLADVALGWSRSVQQPAAAVAFAEAGEHHIWHASTLRDHLPTSAALDAAAAVRAPTKGWERGAATLVGIVEMQSRATAMTRLIHPWLDREFEALFAVCNPTSDRALLRALRFCDLDHSGDLAAIAQLGDSSGAVNLGDRRRLNEIDLSAPPPP